MGKLGANCLVTAVCVAALGAAVLHGASGASSNTTGHYLSPTHVYTVKLIRALHLQCSYMYMSVQNCDGNNKAGFWREDDGSGTQHWTFTPVPGAPDDVYTISSVSRSLGGCSSQLTAGTGCSSKAVSLDIALQMPGNYIDTLDPSSASDNPNGFNTQAFRLRLFQPQVYQIESVKLKDECRLQAASLATTDSSPRDPCGSSATTMVSEIAAIYAERGLFLIEPAGCRPAPAGYQLYTDVLIRGTSDATKSTAQTKEYNTKMTDNPPTAFSSCSSDPLCAAWDSLGQQAIRARPLRDDTYEYDAPGGCTYAKLVNPAPAVRLVNATEPFEGHVQGRVEVSFNGSWGTACDVVWGDEEARVVCRQMGYPYGYYNRLPRGIYAQNATVDQPIWVSGATCSGAEEHLGQCLAAPADQGATTCDHTQDVGVLCSNEDLELPVRLVATTQPAPGVTMGRVEEFLYGTWRTPCDAGWGDEEARVVCRQLGYLYGYSSRVLGSTAGIIANMTQERQGTFAACTGTEQHLGQCVGLPAVVGQQCDQAQAVLVLCSKETALSLAVPSGGQAVQGCAYNGTGQCLGQDGGTSALPRMAGQSFRVASTVRLTRAEVEVVLGIAWDATLFSTTARKVQFTVSLYTTFDRSDILNDTNVILVASFAPPTAELNVSTIFATARGPGSKVTFTFDVAEPRWVLQAGGYYFIGISSDDNVACSIRVPDMEVAALNPPGCNYPTTAFCKAPLSDCKEVQREPTGQWSARANWIQHIDLYGALLLGAARDEGLDGGCQVPFPPTDGAVVNKTSWCYDTWGVVAFRVDCDGDGVLDAACAKDSREYAVSLSTQGCVPQKADAYDASVCRRVFAPTSAGPVNLCPDLPGYTLYVDTDAGGNNIGFISWWTGDHAFGSVAELVKTQAKLCDSMDTCAGFSSSGYFKMFISIRTRSYLENNCLYAKTKECPSAPPVATLVTPTSLPTAELQSGFCMKSTTNACLKSPNGVYSLCVQSDGRLVLSSGALLGSTSAPGGTPGEAQAPYRLCLLPDGNLVVYDVDGIPIWASFQSGKGPSVLRVQDDGNVVTYTLGGTPTWAAFPLLAGLADNWSEEAGFQVIETKSDEPVNGLQSGTCVTSAGNILFRSPNGHQYLFLGADGNFWQYAVGGGDPHGASLWNFYQYGFGDFKGPYKLCMLDDGNLIAYYGSGSPFWATCQAGQGPSVFNITNDGRVATYRLSDGTATWSTFGGLNFLTPCLKQA